MFLTVTMLITRRRMSATKNLTDEEINRRYNHWDSNNSVSHCKECGSFVNKPPARNGEIRYKCEGCNSWHLEYTG